MPQQTAKPTKQPIKKTTIDFPKPVLARIRKDIAPLNGKVGPTVVRYISEYLDLRERYGADIVAGVIQKFSQPTQ